MSASAGFDRTRSKDYIELPLHHDALLSAIRSCRASEASQCQVLSEMHEAAVQRLIEYSRDVDRVCANARFLNLRETMGEDGTTKSVQCQTEVAAQAALRAMVEQLARAFDKEGVNMTDFKPNHFASLSVYYARFLRKDSNRPQNGLARWCFGIRTFVPGAEIEPEAERREHLASQCLPRHYDASGVAQACLCPFATGENGFAKLVGHESISLGLACKMPTGATDAPRCNSCTSKQWVYTGACLGTRARGP